MGGKGKQTCTSMFFGNTPISFLKFNSNQMLKKVNDNFDRLNFSIANSLVAQLKYSFLMWNSFKTVSFKIISAVIFQEPHLENLQTQKKMDEFSMIFQFMTE
jgi:hypothetical protein